MSINIHQVLDYLDETVVCQRADDIHTLMKLLCDAYHFHNQTTVQDLQEKLASLGSDDPIAAVCGLCRERELLAFSQGVRVGMLLMTEVNYLP